MAGRGRPTKERKIEDVMKEEFLVASNIEILCRRYGTTDARLCELMGVSADTLSRRRKQPWTFTLEELHNVAGEWGLSIAQLCVEPRYVVEPAEF